jgi:hypothetical protein
MHPILVPRMPSSTIDGDERKPWGISARLCSWRPHLRFLAGRCRRTCRRRSARSGSRPRHRPHGKITNLRGRHLARRPRYPNGGHRYQWREGVLGFQSRVPPARTRSIRPDRCAHVFSQRVRANVSSRPANPNAPCLVRPDGLGAGSEPDRRNTRGFSTLRERFGFTPGDDESRVRPARCDQQVGAPFPWGDGRHNARTARHPCQAIGFSSTTNARSLRSGIPKRSSP